MKTIVFAASAGGVGRTTLCAALSALAGKHGKTAIIDLDPQGSLTNWWNRRKEEIPDLFMSSAEDLPDTLKEAEAAGYEYVFIDTPCRPLATIKIGIENADFVLVPCQPSIIDVEAIGDTIFIIDELAKSFAFVLNRRITGTNIVDQTVIPLANRGKIAGVPIGQRTVFATAMIDGRTAPEVRNGDKAEEEIKALWNFLLAGLEN